MPSLLSQVFPPSPKFTDKDLPSLAGKVFLVTGAASGVGLELAKMLYVAGGTIYIGARSSARCEGAITRIQKEVEELPTKTKSTPKGTLEALVIDLADLASVRSAALEFLAKEERLDVLVHNAAVMMAPAGSKDALGHDLEVGTNCLGPYLLTILLEPLLIKTAETSPVQFEVRIVWVVSLLSVGGISSEMSYDKDGAPTYLPGGMNNYLQSKIGCAWLAVEFAKRLGSHGIMSVSVHPGLMKTELQRTMPAINRIVMSAIFKGPVYGAYSELYCAFSPELTAEHNGTYVLAWGRIAGLPANIAKSGKSKAEGGTGNGEKFLSYCEKETRSYF